MAAAREGRNTCASVALTPGQRQWLLEAGYHFEGINGVEFTIRWQG